MTKQEAIAYCEERIKHAKPEYITKDLYTAVLGLINGGLVDAGIQGYDKRKRFIVYGPKNYETREVEILTGGDFKEDFAQLKSLCSEVGELVPRKSGSKDYWILKLDEE